VEGSGDPQDVSPAASSITDDAVAGADLPDLSPTRPRWPRWIALGALAAFIALAAALGSRFGTDPTVVDSPLIGAPAPEFALPYLEKDGRLALVDLERQIVVLNFWASWCTVCKEEHADLMAAAYRYQDAGVRFLGVVFQDQPANAIDFLDEMGRGYDNLEDPRSATAIDYGVFGVPETFFIDRQGTVVAKVIGRVDIDLLQRTLDAILEGRTPESINRAGYQPESVDLTVERVIPQH
jgi:cytochrome c biogenesis protein CcmG/thiol:disulfide interchange protein DsbE